MMSNRRWNRRAVLQAATGIAGVAATAPLPVELALALPGSSNADALFLAGEFEQAGHAYEEILGADPGNLHAARQRGYVALLSNRFPDAEKYLKLALTLAPDDEETNRFLADCYTRQDKFPLAAPCWQAAGDDAFAQVFGAFSGTPYEIHGEIGRAPWLRMDPSPLVELSLNDGPPQRFAFYTRVGSVGMSARVAEEAGLRAVAEQTLDYIDPPLTMSFGILDSLKLGGIEVRNIPVSWTDDEQTGPTGGSGMIGTWLFYHFLTTIDYAGRSLILRRRTPETAAQVRSAAEQGGAGPLPLWLAHEHIPFSQGSIAGSGPRVMGLNIGGLGEDVGGMAVETAEQLQVRIDYNRPLETSAGLQPVTVYPCYPEEIRLGNAVARDSYCIANQRPARPQHGFEVLGHFAHTFFKPYHVTLDFTAMNLYIVPGRAG